MKKCLGITVALAFAIAAFPQVTQAQSGTPLAAPTSLDYVVYNGTVAAAGAAIQTPAAGGYLTAGAEDIDVHLTNLGAGARSAIIECWDPSNAITTHIYAAVSVPATDEAVVWISPRATGTAPQKYTFIPTMPCHRMSVRAAAATGSMNVLIRKRTGR